MVQFFCGNFFQVPRLVKVTQNHSPYFKIISPSNVGHKVGPGLAITIYIQFLPNEKKVCMTVSYIQENDC